MDEKKTSSGFLDFNFAVLLHNFANAAKRLIWIVILLSVIVGAVVYVQVDKSFVPSYSVSAVFSVHASYAASTDILSHSDFLDSNAAQMLSQTFPYVIQSENARMLLSLELGKNVVRPTITATSTADAGLFTMTVTDTDPEEAYETLKAAITIYPQAASSILGDTQINVINMPLSPPTEPDNRNTALVSALKIAAVVFFFGLLAIFLLSLARKTVHSAEDLRKLVNLKCLAYIPRVKLKKHTNKSNLTLTITNPRVNSSFSECVRNLRVKLQKVLPSKDGCKVLLITSTLPNEGKTTVATNLALSLAAEGKHVILIDGDLRKQSLKTSVGLSEPSDGLVEILSGDLKNFHLLNVPNSTLLLICGDETTDRPQPLLDTPKMRQLLDHLKESMDYIIIDSPPAGILSDAATTAKYADATLYVVRQDLANCTQIVNSIQSLSSNGVNIIGCILNQTQAGTTRYGYASKYANNYGYSYGYKYSNNYYYYGKKQYSRYAEAEDTAETLSKELSDALSSNHNNEEE